MIDYDKIYRKSVYKEHFDEYYKTWKDAVTKKRIIEMIPHINNLEESTLKDLQEEWSSYTSNSYTKLVISLLESYDGFEALRLFTLIHKSYSKKDNESFIEAIQCLHMHLKNYPTLISFFPRNLMTFLNLLQTSQDTYVPNTIFISKKTHEYTCNMCKNDGVLYSVQCICSSIFICDRCMKSCNSKCSICSYTYNCK